jgi:hypothetical protein
VSDQEGQLDALCLRAAAINVAEMELNRDSVGELHHRNGVEIRHQDGWANAARIGEGDLRVEVYGMP